MTLLQTVTATATELAFLAPALIPDPAPAQPPGTEGITTVISWLKWIGYVVVGGAIVIGGILIAVSFRRGEGQDALPKILWPMGGAIVIGAGAAWVSTIAAS
ncbi:hypothetical protein [Aquipuribacter hungaricus]|uniref:TrbC/VIRB2 family protein n=1 Tax=Aquipuribacter hungaricus TaxID=545624 RepID=A0ABV7WMW4_9MICO